MDPDRFYVAALGPEVELKIKGSRFLGRIFPANTLEEAASRVEQVRKIHYNATHHCWAARAEGPDRTVARFDDDGEPSGTAGAPILKQLERADRHRVLCVVTRYYGGAKLGTGGLAKAYGQSAALALEAAPPRVCYRSKVLQVAAPFDDLGSVESLIAKNGDAILSVVREFGEGSSFSLTVKASRAESVASLLTEATAGRASLNWGEG